MQGSRTQRDYPGVPTWLMNSKAPHTIEDLPTRLREYGFNFESAGDLAEAIGKMSARGMDAARNPGRTKSGAFGADGVVKEICCNLLPHRGVSAEGAGVGDGPLSAIGIDAVVVPRLDNAILHGALRLAIYIAEGGVGEEPAGGNRDGCERIGIGIRGDEASGGSDKNRYVPVIGF